MAIVGRVTVDTAILKSRASEVRSLGNSVKSNLDEILRIMESTKGYWIGEAGDLNRKLYADQKDEIQFMMKRIMEHPDDLEIMAGVYETSENTNVSTSMSLKENIL